MKYKKTTALMAAAAFAATAPLSVLAVVDLDSATEVSLKYSDELKGAVDANGRIEVDTNANDLDVAGAAGFAVATGSVIRYYRFDLTGAAFEGTPTLSQATVKVANNAQAGVALAGALQNGGDDESYAIFKVTTATNTDEVISASDLTLACAKYDLDPTVTANVQYQMFETVSNAANSVNPLVNKNINLAQFVSGANYAGVVEAVAATATVASGFTKFTGAVTLASIGLLDSGDVITTAADAANNTLKITGATSAAADYITAAQTLTLTGDVSVGVFSSFVNANCTGAEIACVKAADNGSCTIASTATAADQSICIELGAITAGTTLAKGDYSLAFATDTGMDASLGSVSYDTTSVEVPYVTTYDGYNQRIFIDNRGTTAAYYSTTFTTENGVTAASGASGTGTLAAGEMTTVKAADLVTFTGGTRGTATIEIEAQDTKLKVVTQIVDLGTGMTDTILLHPSTQ
jgi:hypothetical protein